MQIVTFDLINLWFRGGDRYVAEDGRRTRGRIPIHLPGIPEITLERRHAINESLPEPGGFVQGTTAKIELGTDKMSFDHLKEVVQRVCYLLTIATGTVVNWRCAELRDADSGNVIAGEARSTLVMPFSRWRPPIDARDANVLRSFVEQCYESFVRCETEYKLAVVSHALAACRQSDTFLETRGLSAVALLEHVLNCVTNHLPAPISPELFAERGDRLRAALNRAVQSVFPEVPSEIIEQVTPTATDVNRHKFRYRLDSAARILSVPMTPKERQTVVAVRNQLVHVMRYPKGAKSYEQLFMLIALLDRFILRLLGYTGDYIDATDLTTRRLVSPDVGVEAIN